jgi:hypothetical protein
VSVRIDRAEFFAGELGRNRFELDVLGYDNDYAIGGDGESADNTNSAARRKLRKAAVHKLPYGFNREGAVVMIQPAVPFDEAGGYYGKGDSSGILIGRAFCRNGSLATFIIRSLRWPYHHREFTPNCTATHYPASS